jgi:hypothetical protein
MLIKTNWEVEDGYAGKSRPYQTIINTRDYMSDQEWDELTYQEKEEIIDEEIQLDYQSKISYYIKDYGI